MTRPRSAGPVAAATPMKPRRGLLVITSILFGLWVAALIAMYFGTVYRQRHSPMPTNASTPAVPAPGTR